MIKLVAFDFDGVFINSGYECYLVCLEAFKRMGFRLEKSKALYKKFLNARVFVLGGEDFYPVLKGLSDPKIDFSRFGIKDFENLRGKYSSGIKEFTGLFYGVRKEMQEKNFEGWCEMHRFYPGILDAYSRLSANYKTVIATSKNRESVYLLLKNMGFSMQKEDITGRELSTIKADQIRFLAERSNISLNEIFFLEDMFETAAEMKKLGVHIALVSWGYSNPQQRKLAKAMKIPIITRGNVLRKIEKLISNYHVS